MDNEHSAKISRDEHWAMILGRQLDLDISTDAETLELDETGGALSRVDPTDPRAVLDPVMSYLMPWCF